MEMSGKIDLKKIERRAYLSYHNDGIIDIYLGFSAIFYCVCILADMIAIAGGIIAIIPLFYISSKKAITVPRLGYVKFAPERVKKTKNIMTYLLIAGVLSTFLGVIAFMNPNARKFFIENGILILGVSGTSIFSLVAYLSDIKRFYMYGALTLIAFLSINIFQIALFQSLIALGSLIMFSGIILLYRFLQKYPKTDLGEAQ